MNNNEQKSVEPEHFAIPEVSEKQSFSPVWILPVVALLIGLGLIIKSYLNAGIMITLQIPSAEGIEVGKTQVLYKGITAGVVKKYSVTENLQSIILSIEMDKKTESFLNENSKFWIVEPRVSLSGVSGLDTLIGGRYIAMEIDDKGKPKRDFVSLSVPPPPSTDVPGLHIKLRLNRLASVDRGTIIYYKQIPVGEVTNYTLAENDTEIHAWVIIKPEFSHLVKEGSLFYNVSGLNIEAGLSGVKVETESLISVLAGGIAFYNSPDIENKPAQRGSFYFLYSDFESAKIGIPIVLRFTSVESIQENNTEIRFQGKKIGSVGQFTYDKLTNEIIALATIDPLMEKTLTENTQFWIVKPSVNLLDISGLDALFSGNYIQIRPTSEGEPKHEFTVLESVPVLPQETPGLHFYIETDALGSINKDAPVYYKNISVGHIESFKFTQDSKKVRLKGFIKPEFAHLVKKNSRFYNVSGLNIKGGVSGIKVNIESLTTLLKGGISFYTPEHEPSEETVNNGHIYKLYNDFDDAKAGIEVSLIFDSAEGLVEGSTKIIYKGIVLGIIQKITPHKKHKNITATAVLDPIAALALVEDTKFWMVKPTISLTKVKNLETLISGRYITLRVGTSKNKKTSFKVTQNRPPLDHNYPGLHLKIKNSVLGAINIGSPILYHGIKIGDVQDYELATDRNNINILVHIWPQYMNMISTQSRFYNVSGLHVDASLSGVEIQTGSIETIVNGGIALFNDNNSSTTYKRSKKISNGHSFKLFKDLKAAQRNAFYVQVRFNEPKGLSVGSKVQYRGINVGEVEAIALNDKEPNSIRVTLELDSALKSILGECSAFWIKTAKIGLTKTEDLDTLIRGAYISINPVKGKFVSSFVGLEERPLVHRKSNSFTVNLTASRLSSVKIGDPVYYRQVKVGTVVGYELADTADQILIYLSIRNRFKPLIRENSQFWHASGIAMDIQLFGTTKIRTESMEAILSGGIAFATPDNETMGEMLSSDSFYILHDEPKPEWTQWNPIIHLPKETLQN